MAAKDLSFTCPRCGAPLPMPSEDGFATCGYCGVRAEIASLAPPSHAPHGGAEASRPPELPTDSSEDDVRRSSPSYILRVVVAVVVFAVVITVIVASQPQSQSTSGSSSVAHCSVAIDASATSGPAPFTSTFTANVTAPPGDFTSEPMWQFGPFPPGFDLNFTYGSTVTHTWNVSGSFGVHVSVPDSTGQGCYTTMTVDVT